MGKLVVFLPGQRKTIFSPSNKHKDDLTLWRRLQKCLKNFVVAHCRVTVSIFRGPAPS